MFTVSPDHGEVHPAGRADIADDDRAGMQADAHADRELAGGAAHRIVLADGPGDGQRRANRVIGMVLHAGQPAPHRHNRIADILVDHAVLMVDAGAEQGEVVV